MQDFYAVKKTRTRDQNNYFLRLRHCVFGFHVITKKFNVFQPNLSGCNFEILNLLLPTMGTKYN